MYGGAAMTNTSWNNYIVLDASTSTFSRGKMRLDQKSYGLNHTGILVPHYRKDLCLRYTLKHIFLIFLNFFYTTISIDKTITRYRSQIFNIHAL